MSERDNTQKIMKSKGKDQKRSAVTPKAGISMDFFLLMSLHIL